MPSKIGKTGYKITTLIEGKQVFEFELIYLSIMAWLGFSMLDKSLPEVYEFVSSELNDVSIENRFACKLCGLVGVAPTLFYFSPKTGTYKPITPSVNFREWNGKCHSCGRRYFNNDISLLYVGVIMRMGEPKHMFFVDPNKPLECPHCKASFTVLQMDCEEKANAG